MIYATSWYTRVFTVQGHQISGVGVSMSGGQLRVEEMLGLVYSWQEGRYETGREVKNLMNQIERGFMDWRKLDGCHLSRLVE
jgi:hypothetical protein